MITFYSVHRRRRFYSFYNVFSLLSGLRARYGAVYLYFKHLFIPHRGDHLLRQTTQHMALRAPHTRNEKRVARVVVTYTLQLLLNVLLNVVHSIPLRSHYELTSFKHPPYQPRTSRNARPCHLVNCKKPDFGKLRAVMRFNRIIIAQ